MMMMICAKKQCVKVQGGRRWAAAFQAKTMESLLLVSNRVFVLLFANFHCFFLFLCFASSLFLYFSTMFGESTISAATY